MGQNRLQNETREPSVTVLYGADKFVWAWHLAHLGIEPVNMRSIDAAIGIQKDGKLIASVIYSRYRHPDIEVGIHSIDKRWCNRRTLRAIFSYPFVQLGCTRVTAQTDPVNPTVCNFLKRIGFVEEGRLRNALPHGDSLILGMLRHECRWVE